MEQRKPYAPVHVDMAEHPKIADLSDRAFRAHVRGILYANRLLTDGRVPDATAREYGRRAVTELITRGVWERNGKGYIIHDFAEWNPTKAEIEARREAKAAAGRASAQQKANSRSAPVPAPVEQVLEQRPNRKSTTRAGGTSTTTTTPEKTTQEKTLAPRNGAGAWNVLISLFGEPPKNPRLRTSWAMAAQEIESTGYSASEIRGCYANAGDRTFMVATPMAFAKYVRQLALGPPKRAPRGAVEESLAHAARLREQGR